MTARGSWLRMITVNQHGTSLAVPIRTWRNRYVSSGTAMDVRPSPSRVSLPGALWHRRGAALAAAVDPTLDRRGDRASVRDVLRHHLVHHLAGGRAAGEVGIAVAASGDEVVGRQQVGRRLG